MKSSARWVPLRWRSGPLDIAQLKNPEEADREALIDAQQPAALSFLSRTPINCLVLTWAAGMAQDAGQQSVLKPLLARAKQMGLALVGSVTGDHDKAVHSAQSAGFDAVLIDKAVRNSPPNLSVIPVGPVATLSAPPAGVVAVGDAVWPQVPVRRGRGDAAGGPTGTPWVDANGWRVQLANAKAPGSVVWLLGQPPAGVALGEGSYSVAVADAGAYGARWVVSLDPKTQLGLLREDRRAQQTWKTITDTVAFFEKDRGWAGQSPVVRSGAISDFVGANRMLAQETINLAARRPFPVRVIDRATFTADSLQGLKAVLWIDAQASGDEVQKALDHFVNTGGFLMMPKGVAPLATSWKSAGSHEARYDLFEAAQDGRVAVATKPWSDPFLLAADFHLLFSRKHDVIRAWNAGSSNFNYTASKDNKSAVVQIVNYTGRASGGDMSLYIAQRYKTALMHRLNGETERLQVAPKSEGVEVYLPPFAAYAAIEYGA